MPKRKKKSSLARNIGYIFFISMIILALWSACGPEREITHKPSPEYAAAKELMAVKIPGDIPSIFKEYEGFDVSFNPEHRVPNFASWELTADEARAQQASRNDAGFNPDVTVDQCSALEDYKNSGYDRGHMCPAGDMKWSVQAMRDCFLLTNMCPQAHALNNGAWKSLEESCRTWAVRDSALIIVCGPILTDKIIRKIGPNQVTVPERFFKVILAPYANPPRAIGFIMPNSSVKGGFQKAAVSVDEVERITSMDFFSALPDDIEDKIEAESDTREWFYFH
ncbi:MAG: DNA/RNA non-specific endonuclease [Clostridium sp.]|nr:DNA/RNA non-specific endonuclease [Clostridium sp.]